MTQLSRFVGSFCRYLFSLKLFCCPVNTITSYQGSVHQRFC